MLKVFVSYRRSDSEDFAGRLYSELKDEFEVFFDNEKLDYGVEFPQKLKEEVESSDIFLLVVGKDFCSELDAKKSQTDFMLEEIKVAKESGCGILPILQDGVEMPECLKNHTEIKFIADLNAFLFGRGEFKMYIDHLKSKISSKPKRKVFKEKFVKDVLDAVKQQKMLVLFYQDFTNIDQYRDSIKAHIKDEFKDNYLEVSVLPFNNNEKEYFACIAKDCGVSCEVKDASSWYQSMREELLRNGSDVLLFINNVERGDKKLDKMFAQMLKDLKDEFSNFHVILIGRRDLAKLVYGEGSLSPLNNAKELFFPQDMVELDEDRITQQLTSLSNYKDSICELLDKEKITRYSTWSYDEAINMLFWKNLLVKKDSYLYWRDNKVKEIANEVLKCDSKAK